VVSRGIGVSIFRGRVAGRGGGGKTQGDGVGAESDLAVRRAWRGGGRKGFQWVGCER